MREVSCKGTGSSGLPTSSRTLCRPEVVKLIPSSSPSLPHILLASLASRAADRSCYRCWSMLGVGAPRLASGVASLHWAPTTTVMQTGFAMLEVGGVLLIMPREQACWRDKKKDFAPVGWDRKFYLFCSKERLVQGHPLDDRSFYVYLRTRANLSWWAYYSYPTNNSSSIPRVPQGLHTTPVSAASPI